MRSLYLFDLSGKVAVITGGRRGLGLVMAEGLAVKWAKYHIHVNAIAPAFIETNLTRATMEKGEAHILSHVPIGRFGLPEDLKGAVLFLSSAASDYITGTILFVDGGYRAM